MRRLIPGAIFVLAGLGCAHPCLAADRPPFRIEPGPEAMTPEEAALLPDASAGTQHALVLVDDTLRDDKIPEIGRHLRVKLFSRAWRGAGDIAIPYEARALLKTWWARIIPPRGPAIEMGKEDLVEQVVARRGGRKVRVLKLALPGVAPGSVLDIGYVLRTSGGDWTRIPLQQPWAVRRLRYWWAPYLGIPSQYYVRRRPDLHATVTRGKDSVFLEATDLPLFVDERWSPPEDLIRAGAILHYTFDQPNADPNVFWDDVARQEEEETKEFLKDRELLAALIGELHLPASGTLDEKLRAAYDWIGAHIKNVSRLTSEEEEALHIAREVEREKEKRSAYSTHRKRGTLQDIIEHREAPADSLDRLFLGISRALGAQAHLVLVSDRSYEFWDRTLFSRFQFSDQVVAVLRPSEPPERAAFVDPGSGLPYGHVRWAFTATKGLMVTREGAREVAVPFIRADLNLLETRADVDFDATSGAARVTWSAAGKGQRGLEERDSLRSLSPDRRQDELRGQCGEGAEMEVSRAASPGLEDPGGSYALECDGDLAELAPDTTQDVFSFQFDGTWIPRVPVLVSPERTHPVVFPYLWNDRTLVTVRAPAGFVPGTPPRDVVLRSPFGDYNLAVRGRDAAFEIERSLSLTALTVRPEQYAALRRFLQDVRRADGVPVTFRREGGRR